MSGLMGNLAMAARALDAQRYGLEVTGQNIANVNTPGYTRRTPVFAAVPGTTRLSAGNGVEVAGLRAARDERIERRLLQERPAEQREAAVAESLQTVETALGLPGASLDGSMNEFFDAFARLAADPTSTSVRGQVLVQGEAMAGRFRDMAARLDQERRDADGAIRGAVAQINELAGRVASLNAALGAAPGGGGESLHLQDELAQVLGQLSDLVDISTIARPDGGADVSVAGGRALVIGANPYHLDVVSTPPSGLAAIQSQGTDITAQIANGRIGGLLEVRDRLIVSYQENLDTLAFSLATEVNALHQGGRDLAGDLGLAFFTPVVEAGAARSLRVNGALSGKPDLVAASGGNGAGDNANARRLADLRAKPAVDGTATFGEAWGELVYVVGSDAASARADLASRGEIVRQIELLREQASGVSLDEEAMMMMKFQRAYEANARFFTVIDSALETLINTLVR